MNLNDKLYYSSNYKFLKHKDFQGLENLQAVPILYFEALQMSENRLC